ncbi:hypothetical protein GGR56DRAFT_612559 [Xylariaceae sp. FL0804]|nr:hypothetical protein GGR56DRAFT_612559 [Xylariaceae sp. FL0804]
MAYPPPAKRQRSNTSRESANTTPQTSAPALRGPPPPVNPGLASLYEAGDYGNASYAATPTAHQSIAYAPYSHNGYPGSYHHSSAAAAAAYGSYSSQQQPTAYATPYQPAQQSPHLPSHTAHYSQPTLNGLQNGGYSPAATRPYSPITADHHAAAAAYQQQPQPPSHAHATHIQHSQPSLPQYGDAYTSHTPPQAAPYQAAPAPYADPTVAQHYSPAPMPTPQHDARHVSDGSVGNEDEDAQGETADESSELYQNPDPPPRPSMPTPSTEHSKPPEHKCSCKKGRGKKKACTSCVCSKYGGSCTSACACRNACGNPFADLTAFFGPSSLFPKPCGANPCFASWLLDQPNIEELDVDLMVDMVLDDDASWSSMREYTDAFQRWEGSWKKAKVGKGKKNREDRERLEFELLRGGLGNCNQDDFHGYWYSFCHRKWVPTDHWSHCLECRKCLPSAEWHCEKHDRCTTDRVCPDCATTAAAPYQDIYAEQGR